MNFENYYKADSTGKVEQTKEMILAAVINRIKPITENKIKRDGEKR